MSSALNHTMRALPAADWFFATSQCCGCFITDSCLILLLSNSVPEGCDDTVCSQQAVLCKTCSQLVITNLAAVLSMQTICFFEKTVNKVPGKV